MAQRVTYHPGGFVAAAVQKNMASRADSATGLYTTWSQAGAQTGQRALTSDEAAELAADDSMRTADTNGDTLRSRAQNALTANSVFLAIPVATNAQVLAQTRALTRQSSALIRLLLGQLDTISDT